MRNLLFIMTLLLAGALPAQEQNMSLVPHSPDDPGHPRSTRAVIVGISDYQSAQMPDLLYAHRSAGAFATWLQSPAGGKLRNDQFILLTDSMATLAGIATALDWLAESVQEGDLAVVYFAGRAGLRTQQNEPEPFLLTFDSPPSDFQAGAFSIENLNRALRVLSEEKKSRVILVTDLVLPGKAALASGIIARRLPETGIAGVLSCQPYEVAWQNTPGRSGFFTQHGLEGLYGLADENRDQTVSLQELRRYFEQKTAQGSLPADLHWWGSPDLPLARVQPDYIGKLLFYKNRSLEIPNTGEESAAAESAPDQTSPERRAQYAVFTETLQRGDLVDPPGYCAWEIYAQLTPEQAADRLGKRMRRELCAALQDEAQQALNALVADDPYEINNWRFNAARYQQYPDYLRRARELLGYGHYLTAALRAKQLYFEAYSLSHNNPELERSATAAETAKQLAKAKLREALEYQPDAAYLYQAAGYLHFNDYTLDSFMYYYTRAMECSPNWIVPYLDVGQKYMWVFVDLKMAERWFKKALSIDPESYVALEKLAWLYQWKYDLPKAIETCQRMIALRPDLNNGYSTLGNIFLALKNYGMAERYAQEALRLNPKLWWWSYRDLGVVYLRTSRYEQGVSHFEQALARSDIDQEDKIALLESLAAGQIEYGNYAAAEATLQRHARLANQVALWNHANRESMRGKAAALSGRFAEADSILRHALSIDPTPNPYYIMGYTYLGVAAQGMGQPDSARAFFERAVAYTTNVRFMDQIFCADAHYRFGLYWMQLGRHRTARKEFRRAIEVDPGWYAGYYGLALWYARKNRSWPAMDYLERALLRHYPERASIDADPAFDKIRTKNRFLKIMKRQFDFSGP